MKIWRESKGIKGILNKEMFWDEKAERGLRDLKKMREKLTCQAFIAMGYATLLLLQGEKN